MSFNKDIKKISKEIEEQSKLMETKAGELEKVGKLLDTNIETYESNTKTKLTNVKSDLASYKEKLKYLLIGLGVGSLLIFFIGAILLETTLNQIYIVIIVFALFAILLFSIFKLFPEDLIENNSDPYTKLISQTLANGKIITGYTLTILKSFVPQVQNLIDEVGKQNNWVIFAESLKNATKLYGIDIDEVKQGTSIASSETNLWLDETANELSKQIGIDKLIIKLSYYDYVSDNENLKNTWKEIKDNKIEKELIAHLIELRYKKMLGNEISGYKHNVRSIIDIISEDDTFTLDEFDALMYQLHKTLLKQKLQIIEVLKGYKLNLIFPDDFEKLIIDFIPKSQKKEEWVSELIEFISKQFKIDIKIIELFISSRIDINIKLGGIFKEIQDSDKLLGNLVDILIKIEAIRIPTTYVFNSNVRVHMMQIIKTIPTFDTDFISSTFEERLSNINTVKQLFLKVINSYKIFELDRSKTINKFLPNENIEQDTAIYLSTLCGIKENILMLLYLDFIGRNTEDLFESIIKKDLEIQILAEAICKISINLNFNKTNNIQNLIALLKIQTDFNLNQVLFTLPIFDRYVNYSIGLKKFLYKEELINDKKELQLTTTSQLFKESAAASNIYEKLKLVCNWILKNNNYENLENDNIGAVISSILTVYLFSREDNDSSYACKESSRIKMATRILYHYVAEKEESEYNKSDEVKLNKTINDVLTNASVTYEHLGDFTSHLGNGLLPASISQLLSKRLEIIKEEIALIKERFDKGISTPNLKDKMHKFLEHRISSEIVKQSIGSRIFSAYLITVSSGSKGRSLGGIFDKYLPIAIDGLKKKDSRYGSSIFISAAEKSIGGKGTRLGVSPPTIKFEDVTKMLEDALKIAITNYDKFEKTKAAVAYNIARIDLSKSTFKHMSFGSIIGNDPETVIKSLILEKFSALSNLEILAVNKSDTPERIAIRDLIKEFFNEETIIYALIEDMISNVIKEVKTITYINNKIFDRALFGKYGVNNLCGFATKIYELSNSMGSDKVKEKLKKSLNEILVDSNQMSTEEEIVNLSSLIYDRLYNIGEIIQI